MPFFYFSFFTFVIIFLYHVFIVLRYKKLRAALAIYGKNKTDKLKPTTKETK